MSTIQNPHDLYIRNVMSEKETARSFFENYLPKEISEQMDFEVMTAEKDTFIDEELKEYFSDILYSTKIGDKPLKVYFLFEHKSYNADLVLLQLLNYMVKIWKKDEKEEDLPLIIPLVLYHGKEKWTSKLNFRSLFSSYEEIYHKFIPEFEYLKYDLSEYKDHEIVGQSNLVITLRILKHLFDGTLLDELKELGELFKDLGNTTSAGEYFEVTIRYLLNVLKDDVPVGEIIKSLENSLTKERRDGIMSIAEALEKKGKIEGMKEGELKGKIETVEKMIRKGFKLEDIIEITGFTEKEIEDIKQNMLKKDVA